MSNSETKQKIKERSAEITKQINEKYETLQTEIDKIKVEAMKGSAFQPSGNAFANSLTKALQNNSEALKSFSEGGRDRVAMELKDLTAGGNFTGEVIPATRMGGISYDPDRSRHVRDFMPITPTTSDLVRYVVETSYTDGVEGQAESQLKGETEANLEAETVEVKTRATWVRLSKQMLSDTPFLRSYLNSRVPGKVKEDEDLQILYGDGTGENLSGLTAAAQAYSSQLEAANITSRYDVLVDAITQLENDVAGEYSPNAIMIRPAEYYNMAIAKASDGHYLHPAEVRAGNAPMRIQGVQIVPISAINGDDFLVGDFRRGATLAQREGMSAQFYYEDRDNVVTNRVTFLVEHRIALPITNPNAFVYGNFTDALASGT